MTITFFRAVIGWIIFRAENMTQAVDFLTAMFTNQFFDMSNLHGVTFTLYGLMLLVVEWIQRDKQHALQIPSCGLFKFTVTRYLLYFVIVYIMFQYSGEVQTFIYFQF